METNIFGKFSNLRRKNQPLTLLTELYSKIANESIYYNKLASMGNHKRALQGWKALTTDALFQLTMIEKNYPHTENYTVDELSLLSGVRELYHKAQKNLDSLQDNFNNNPDWNDLNSNQTNNSYHTRDHKASLNRLQSISSTGSLTGHGFARTTLRENDYSNSNSLSMRAHNYNLAYNDSKPVRVNFSNSKSIGSIDVNHKSNKAFEPVNPFVDFTDDIDTSTSNNSDNNNNNNNDIFLNSYDNQNDNIQDNSNNNGDINTDNSDDTEDSALYDNLNDDDFDVSDIYQDSDEYENESDEARDFNNNTVTNNIHEHNNSNYIQIDNEYMSRLNALNTLIGSRDSHNSKESKISNDSTTDRLSSLSLDDSDANNNSNNNTKEFSAPSDLPPRLPQLPQMPPVPISRPRVPVIVQQSPSISTSSPLPQSKIPVNKKHNLLNKGNVLKDSKQLSSGFLKNNSGNSIDNHNNTKFNNSLPPSQIHLRTKEKIPKIKAASTSTLPMHRSHSGSSEKLQRQISPTQAAKLVYKNKSNNNYSNNLLESPKLHRYASNSGESVPMKKKIVLKKNIAQRPLGSKPTNKSSTKLKINSGNQSPSPSTASTTSTIRKTKPVANSTVRTNKQITTAKKSVIRKPVTSASSSSPNTAGKAYKTTRTSPARKIATDDNKKQNKSINTNNNIEQRRSIKSNKSNESLNNEGTSGVPDIAKNETDNDTVNEVDSDDEFLATMPNIDKALGKQILQNIIVQGDEVHWDDIAGLNAAKNSLKEAVVYPFLRPDLFMGLREPVTGMLLFGPPGTGKTMLARAVACESHSTFFSISASSLTSKYLGESEKLVRALFTLAQKLSPSIIFVDEIDSILGSRNQDGENESSRRIKNEFLIQWSALSRAAAGKDKKNDQEEDKRVLVLAATNLPWSIDDAARRRFVRRQYIPLPEDETRKVQIQKLLSYQKHTISDEDFKKLIELTNGYSGSDITSLAKDAAMGPLRELGDQLLEIGRDNIRPIDLRDFENSLQYIKPSVSKDGLREYEDWAKQFGSSGS